MTVYSGHPVPTPGMDRMICTTLRHSVYGSSPSSSSSHMRVMNHNWSATKQRLHPQSVAEISRHSVLLGDMIQQCGTSSGSCHNVGHCLGLATRTQISVFKSPFLSAGTAVFL